MNGLNKLKQEWNDNPVQVVAVLSAAAYSAAKLLDAYSSLKGRRAYAKQVNLRERGL